MAVECSEEKNDGKWRISKVVQPHTCLDNHGQERHPQLTARYIARRILGLVDKDNDILIPILQEHIRNLTSYQAKYGKVWRAKQIALAIRWGS